MRKIIKLTIPILLILSLLVLGSTKWHAPTRLENVNAAEADYFLKIKGVDGEARDVEIEILSWSWGETSEAALLLPAVQKVRDAANRGQLDAVAQTMTFSMHMSKASPILMQFAASGTPITDEVVLTNERAGREPQDYFIIKMKPVYITSYQTGASSGDIVPVDTISINFSAIKFEYNPDGGDPIEGSWNFKTNSKEY